MRVRRAPWQTVQCATPASAHRTRVAPARVWGEAPPAPFFTDEADAREAARDQREADDADRIACEDFPVEYALRRARLGRGA
jgi:hypothetical protein